MNRRQFLTLCVKSAMAAGMTSAIPAALLRSHTAHAAILAAGLADPARQPLFENHVPNALAGGFKFVPKNGKLQIQMAQAWHMSGLVGSDGTRKSTPIWGYGVRGGQVTWPGRTLELRAGEPLEVSWENNLVDERQMPLRHLLPVDTSLHWAYSLPGFAHYTIAEQGVPVVPHVHGGHNDSPFDGNPEYFFSPGFKVVGPRWEARKYRYGGPGWNDVAGMCWYHDHALGLTRLNVYAGLAGLFVVRDELDTGRADNPLGLPADPYELGLAVQDRMFLDSGELFYPAFPGDPFYDDFITGEGAELPEDRFPNGGPTALAEFFGDHMLVNGLLWPKCDVEPRQYRVRLLNGCDSRFMRLRLSVVPAGETDPMWGKPMPFYLIGSDQSLRGSAALTDVVEFAPGERLDLVIDFKDVPFGSRVIVENMLGDAPFGGSLPKPGDLFPDRRTDRVMAFDVVNTFEPAVADTAIRDGGGLAGPVWGAPPLAVPSTVRKLALFEGTDRFGRLMPLLGTAEPVQDVIGNWVNGTLLWDEPITENPALGATEIWEIYNATGDAHPIHLHLVHFEILSRQRFKAELIEQPLGNKRSGEEDEGEAGEGFRLENIQLLGSSRGPELQEQTRRDMVMALPGEVVRIRMTFAKPGRYVWHCHILSHEDHEMMRPYHVGPIEG